MRVTDLHNSTDDAALAPLHRLWTLEGQDTGDPEQLRRIAADRDRLTQTNGAAVRLRKGLNELPGEHPPGLSVAIRLEVIADRLDSIATARQLIRYGLETGSPQALVVAAEILLEHEVTRRALEKSERLPQRDIMFLEGRARAAAPR